MIAPAGIAAIIVSYYPDLHVFEVLLDTLRPQVQNVVVVDNGSDDFLRRWLDEREYSNEVLIPLGDNLGVAFAQNAGIDWARRNGNTHVILLDQDSIPASDMVLHLMSGMCKLTKLGFKVATVGPRYLDARNIKRPSFTTVTGLKVEKTFCRSSVEFVESDTIISSGSLIFLSTLAQIGGPLNELFIDQVDMEWCFRARSYGFSIFGICDAVLHHSLGEAPKKLFWRKYIHQSPLRHYYIFRNAVWLLFKNYVPVGWKILFIRSIIIRLLVYSCLVSPRLSYLNMMTKGIFHGLIGRLGKLKTNSSKA